MAQVHQKSEALMTWAVLTDLVSYWYRDRLTSSDERRFLAGDGVLITFLAGELSLAGVCPYWKQNMIQT